MANQCLLIRSLARNVALAAILAAAQAWAQAPSGATRSTFRGGVVGGGPTADAAQADLTDFLARKNALKPADIDAQVDLANWALSREMYAQASEEARDVLRRDPDNRPAYKVLRGVDDAVQLPREPATEAALKAEMQKRFHRAFKTRNSRHFVIVYDTSDAFAAQRGGSLEKAYEGFMDYFAMNHVRPRFLKKRLVVILFEHREDYLTYARETEHADMGWAEGYYSQFTNRTAFYDDASDPDVLAVDGKLDDARTRLKDLGTQIADARGHGDLALANQLSVERNRLADTLGRVDNRVGNVVGMLNTMKTAHEAAHQLSFNTGIQKRFVDYPLWFSEGLACCFEFEDRSALRGPTVINPGRLIVLKEAIAKHKLVPIDEFIRAPRPKTTDDEQLSILYAEGWGLFHYLYRTDRSGLEKFLQIYDGKKPEVEIPMDEQVRIFHECFGDDVDALNTRFVAYLKTLPVRMP